MNQTEQTPVPSISLAQARELDRAYYLQVWGDRPICIVGGEGCHLIDSDGNRLLDMIGGIAVNVLGHGHPRLAGAIAAQAASMIHCSNYYYNPSQALLAARLAGLSEATGMRGARVFIGNSGAEANEGALKLARGFFYRQGKPRAKVVSALHSFHGRTLATAAATGQSKYSAPFAPLPAGFVHVPFNDLEALRAAVDDDTCAVLLEPIQGESGVVPADPRYLREAESLCRRSGARLIIDEIQTGMGRTGSFFACQDSGIRPDILTLAKGLGGGVPIGALIADGETAKGFVIGDHGTTFGGNPLACAAALAVLDVYQEEHLTERAGRVGAMLIDALRRLGEAQPVIAEVRGRGLMIGIKLTRPLAVAVRDSLRDRGFLVGSVGAEVLRLLPPLILPESAIEPFVRDLGDVLGICAASADRQAASNATA